MKKRILYTVFAAILLLSLLVSCSESTINADEDTGDETASVGEEEEAAETDPEGGDITLLTADPDGNSEENVTEEPDDEAAAEEDHETFAMPDVVGKNEQEAILSLSERKLTVETKREFSDSFDEGTVIVQSLSPDEPVKSGSTVWLTISNGTDTVSKVSIQTKPVRTDYYVGDTIETEGLTLKVTYRSGNTRNINMGYEVSPKKLEEAGTQTIDVTYEGLSDRFDVTVEPEFLTGIAVKTKPGKTNYYINDMLDTAGLVVTASYSNGETKTLDTGYTCRPEQLTQTGEQTITVTYEGFETGYTVSVYGASKILNDNDPAGKTESEARKAFEPYGINVSVEFAASDAAHAGKVLTAQATSEQSIALMIGKQTEFTFEEKNGSIIITGTSGATDFLNIPDTINGLPVAEIADYAFDESQSSGETGLRQVNFPAGLVRIGTGAFSCCEYLQKAVLPDSVEEIGDGAFWSCSALTEVSFGKVKTIGSFAFQYCFGIAEIVIPDSCQSIGEEAFGSVMAAKKIVLPSSLSYIGPGAFTGCSRAEFEAEEGSYAAKYLAESGMGGG